MDNTTYLAGSAISVLKSASRPKKQPPPVEEDIISKGNQMKASITVKKKASPQPIKLLDSLSSTSGLKQDLSQTRLGSYPSKSSLCQLIEEAKSSAR